MGLAKLFEFVSLPERKMFKRKQMAECLLKFGKLYHLLKKNTSGEVSARDVSTIHDLLSEVENVCYMYLGDIEPNVRKAYIELAFENNPEEARRELMTALTRLEEHLGLMAGYYV